MFWLNMIKRITMPSFTLFNYRVEADHPYIYEKIRRLDAGLKYETSFKPACWPETIFIQRSIDDSYGAQRDPLLLCSNCDSSPKLRKKTDHALRFHPVFLDTTSS